MFRRLKEVLAYRKLQKIKSSVRLEDKIQEKAKPYLERQNEIDQEKKEINTIKKENKFPSQSKLLLIFLFINFTVLELFVGQVTIQSFTMAAAAGTMPDFTPLITLIGAVIGETLSYGIYAAKAKAENTQGGITHDIALYNVQNQQNQDGTFG